MEENSSPRQVTAFAPPERSDEAEVNAHVAMIRAADNLCRILDSVGSMILILNRHRQIVFANRGVLKFFRLGVQDTLIGKRPGEAFDCVNADLMLAGCGTSEFCRTCGAVRALMNAQGNKVGDVQECRILRKNGADALDLRISASPIGISGEHFLLVTLSDISSEKRREVLERLFFHDILNTAGALRGYIEMCLTLNDAHRRKYEEMLRETADRFIDEISAQRDLKLAEGNDLSVSPRSISVKSLLEYLRGLFAQHPAAHGRRLMLDEPYPDIEMFSDQMLLQRVLANMIRNSLEATPEGGEATLGCRLNAGMVEFYTRNPGEMPRDAQMQVFQRSYSTKGEGRGLGTYSMKLISERYLHGHVHFTTSAEEGTVFVASYPRLWPE